jgi:hypothetical protein
VHGGIRHPLLSTPLCSGVFGALVKSFEEALRCEPAVRGMRYVLISSSTAIVKEMLTRA